MHVLALMHLLLCPEKEHPVPQPERKATSVNITDLAQYMQHYDSRLLSRHAGSICRHLLMHIGPAKAG